MAIMQSQQCQCCLCVISIFSVLFGVIMASTGVCLVLNYSLMEIDTRGLPPEWQNEEGKKIVGIILICCGIVAMALGGAVSTLFYTVCSRPKPAAPSPCQSQTPEDRGGGEGAIPKTSGSHASGRVARNVGKRKVSKPPRYQSRLPTHPETAELDGSRSSAQLSAAMASVSSHDVTPSLRSPRSQPPIIRVHSNPQQASVPQEVKSEPGGVTLAVQHDLPATSQATGEPNVTSASATQASLSSANAKGMESACGDQADPKSGIEEMATAVKMASPSENERDTRSTSPPCAEEGEGATGQVNTAFVPTCEDEDSDADISEMVLPPSSSNKVDTPQLDSDISTLLT